MSENPLLTKLKQRYDELKEEMICSQSSKPKSGLIQILVQNYLEHQYNSSNVLMYPEIINDIRGEHSGTAIDSFNENLEDRGVVNDGIIDSSITVCAFLKDFIRPDSYLSSYEVKSGENKYITQFKNLKQILTKIIYQPKTELVLVLVPNVDENLSHLTNNIKQFNVIKNKIKALNDKDKYKLFNEMILNTTYDDWSMTAALSMLINLVHDGKTIAETSDESKKNDCISNDQFNILASQFNRLNIEILTIEELAKYDINKEFVFRIIGLLG